MRSLASVREISRIESIPNADNLELAVVDGWRVVVRKGEYKKGDICIYCEIDSLLPCRPEFEFLRKTSYTQLPEAIEGFRIRTLKLRGTLSQGLLIQPNSLPELRRELYLGQDVTQLLGIIKYERPIPTNLSGIMKGDFPSFIPKTNEERVQNLHYLSLLDKTYYATEKLDGSSSTFYIYEGVFGVCSRNIELTESDNNSFWSIAKSLDIPSKLKSLGKDIAIQGELIGEGIQGNKYKLKGHQLYFFNAFDIKEQRRLSLQELSTLLKDLSLSLVPLITTNYKLPPHLDSLLEYAEGSSLLNQKGMSIMREGLVFRTEDNSISFKAISNNWLLKYE